MSWIFERKIRHSDKNGTITALKMFGRWSVKVDGVQQTGPSLQRVWHDAFRKVKDMFPDRAITSILTLGLGGGGDVALYHRAFPGCTITFIEHDPEMVLLVKEIKLYEPFPFPNVIVDDARNAIINLRTQFDLITVDLFRGREPSAHLTDPLFIQSMRNALSPHGLLLINVFSKKECLQNSLPGFTTQGLWKFEHNNVGLFQKD